MHTRRRTSEADGAHRIGSSSGTSESGASLPVRKIGEGEKPRSARFLVIGEPKAQPRLRHFRRGNLIGGYTPPTADKWKVACAVSAREAIAEPWAGAIRLAVWFRLPRPASHLRKDGTLRASAPAQPTCKPDLDNLTKAVLDALTGFAYLDDKQIVELILGKQYADNLADAGCVVNMEQDLA